MKWLARLKNEEAPDPYATKATKPAQWKHKAGSVGFVAYPPAPFQKIEVSEAAANDTATLPSEDPDRCCWPHSEAMNGQEIDTFKARLARFTDKGGSLTDAERLADKLTIRDREGDNRRLCLECAHLHGAGRWHCGNWQQAEIGGPAMQGALVLMLQRCNGFT